MDIKTKQMNQIANFKSPDLLSRRRFRKYWAVWRSSRSFKIIISVVFMLGFTTAAYIFVSHGKQPADPNTALQNETSNLTSQIGKFMDLPEAEQPTLITVTDKAKLRNQDFFQHAQDGDKLLVYAKAKKAILFRPSTGKIIDVANLTSDNGSNG